MADPVDDTFAALQTDRVRYTRARLRFGRFEADLEAATLSRDGVPVKLQPQPFKVLVLLARRAGEVVTREDIRHEVWGEETFVNFDQGLAYCLNQIRSALGEQAQVAQYIQTLPRRGYRFVAPVTFVAPALSTTAAPTGAPITTAARVAPSAGWAAWPRLHRFKPAFGMAATVVATVLLARASGSPQRDVGLAVVAVLPFEELGPEAASDYLGDGMTEEMITEIGRISPDRVAVIARISAMRYKGKHPDLTQVGRELGVSHVLEGTIRREHARVRVTARLVRVADQAQMWARTFDRELGEILLLQAQVAYDVARSVQGTLAADRTRLAAARPMDPEVYALLARARYFSRQRTPESNQKALAAYQEVARRDPASAAAFAGVAWSWMGMAGYGLAPIEEAFQRARAAAREALRLDPSFAEAHAAQALIAAVHDFDWDAAEQGYRRALALDPSDADVHQWLSSLLYIRGRVPEAVEEARRAVASDPASPIMAVSLGDLLVSADRPAEALQHADSALHLDPEYLRAYVLRGRALIHLRRFTEAVEVLEAVSDRQPLRDRPRATVFRARALLASGRREEAIRSVKAVMQDDAWRDGRNDHYESAALLDQMGRRDDAFDALKQSLEARETIVRFALQDEALDGLRGDRRLDEIAQRLGLRSERPR